MFAEKVAFDRVPDAVLDHRLEAVQEKNPARWKTLTESFRGAGCTDGDLVERRAKASKLPNLICTLPGTDPDWIIVSDHYDKVAAGEGAVDNWSGAALLPSLYQSYKKQTLKHTVLFIGFSDEEVGLVGSKAFVKELLPEGLARIKALVNIDSVGTGNIKVWAKRAHRPFTNLAALVGKTMNIEVTGMDVDRVGDSDTHPFLDKKVPVIDFHSLDSTSFRLLHTDKDILSAVDQARYRETYSFLQLPGGLSRLPGSLHRETDQQLIASSEPRSIVW